MKERLVCFYAGLSALAALAFSPLGVSASTIVTEEPGNTVVEDVADDLQLRNCVFDNLETPFNEASLPCSLAPGVPLASPPFTDITMANITALGGTGLVELAITLAASVPETPASPFLAWFWQFENGCVGTEPGPTDKDGVRVLWTPGTGFVANSLVITNCAPREIQFGPPVLFSFSSDRKTVRVHVDMCDLVARGGDPLVWFAGVRRLPFVHPTFTQTLSVDVAPDVFAFKPPPPPLVEFPEDSARWHGGCVAIDIKPGSDPNSINPKSGGRIPVAILSRPGFDAAIQIDQDSLTFGRTGTEASLAFCSSSAEDVNADGLLDLVCHFDTQTAGFQQGDLLGILNARTVGTSPVLLIGRDSVRVVKNRR